MLPAKQRLTKQRDFVRINKSSRPFFTAAWRLKYSANNSAENRYAVVVSTKVSKKATQRNRLKRRAREIIRLNQAKIKAGYDLIVTGQTPGLKLNYQQLQEELLKLLAKARLLK